MAKLRRSRSSRPFDGDSRSRRFVLHEAVKRAETVLLPAFDGWRDGGVSDDTTVAAFGTLDRVFAEYRVDQRYAKLDARPNVTMRSVCVGSVAAFWSYACRSNHRGDHRHGLRETLGNHRNQSRWHHHRARAVHTINHAMKTCRRAWNVAARRNPSTLPLVHSFRAKAVELGLPLLATASLIAWSLSS
jgi:hypothetical protein